MFTKSTCRTSSVHWLYFRHFIYVPDVEKPLNTLSRLGDQIEVQGKSTCRPSSVHQANFSWAISFYWLLKPAISKNPRPGDQFEIFGKTRQVVKIDEGHKIRQFKITTIVCMCDAMLKSLASKLTKIGHFSFNRHYCKSIFDQLTLNWLPNGCFAAYLWRSKKFTNWTQHPTDLLIHFFIFTDVLIIIPQMFPWGCGGIFEKNPKSFQKSPLGGFDACWTREIARM